MSRNNKHVYAGMGFVLASFLVAGAIYDGIKAGAAPDGQISDNATEVLVDQNGSTRINASAVEAEPASAEILVTSEWLMGSWLLVPKGGEDGGTNCSDFNNPAIYALNERTGKIVTFYPNGKYKDFFAYTTPSDEEHYTITSGRWQLQGGQVTLVDAIAQDAFTVPLDSPYPLK